MQLWSGLSVNVITAENMSAVANPILIDVAKTSPTKTWIATIGFAGSRESARKIG